MPLTLLWRTLLMATCCVLVGACASSSAQRIAPGTEGPAYTQVHYKAVEVRGIRIFYREAGDPKKPTLLLLHGFPSSSHMYRDLIPLLASDFHLVAPVARSKA